VDLRDVGGGDLRADRADADAAVPRVEDEVAALEGAAVGAPDRVEEGDVDPLLAAALALLDEAGEVTRLLLLEDQALRPPMAVTRPTSSRAPVAAPADCEALDLLLVPGTFLLDVEPPQPAATRKRALTESSERGQRAKRA
jgi:hypothetical protein